MRWILLLLLIANVLAFGWWQGWFDDEAPPQEVQPQLLRVVPFERLGTPSAARIPPGPAAPRPAVPAPGTSD